MSIVYKLILFLVLPLVATSIAADYSSDYTMAEYGFWNSDLSVGMFMTAPNSPKPGTNAAIRFDIWDRRDHSRLRAGGQVPASLLKVTGNTISVDIADVREFIGPDFFVDESGHPGPLPMRATVRATSDWEERIISTGTWHGPLAGGDYRNSLSRYTTSSAIGTWNIAEYVFANADGRFEKGDFSEHVLTLKDQCSPAVCSNALRLAAAVAAGSNSNWSYNNLASAYYEAMTGDVYVTILMAVPDRGTRAIIELMLWDSREGPLLIQASGYVPASLFKVTGTMVSVNISDLRQYVSPEFFLDDGGYLAPIPMNVTAMKTTDFHDTHIGTRTERQRQPDGTLTILSEKQRYTRSSMAIRGLVADQTLPLPDNAPTEYFGRGDFRTRTR
jgi:hypothetical protein